MPRPRAFRELRLPNGSTRDPCLFVDDQGRDNALLIDCGDNALLIDCGDNAVLGDDRFTDLEGVFLTHQHVDQFIGFDRVVRANRDRDKAVHFFWSGRNNRQGLQSDQELRIRTARQVAHLLYELIYGAPTGCGNIFPKRTSRCDTTPIVRSSGIVFFAAQNDHLFSRLIN